MWTHLPNQSMTMAGSAGTFGQLNAADARLSGRLGTSTFRTMAGLRGWRVYAMSCNSFLALVPAGMVR